MQLFVDQTNQQIQVLSVFVFCLPVAYHNTSKLQRSAVILVIAIAAFPYVYLSYYYYSMHLLPFLFFVWRGRLVRCVHCATRVACYCAAGNILHIACFYEYIIVSSYLHRIIWLPMTNVTPKSN